VMDDVDGSSVMVGSGVARGSIESKDLMDMFGEGKEDMRRSLAIER
jgi:hypothetical protein